jgi:hypothetical protein
MSILGQQKRAQELQKEIDELIAGEKPVTSPRERANQTAATTRKFSKTREEIIAKYESHFASMTDEERDEIIATCACEKNHEYSARTMLAAMKDPDNEEGQTFLNAAMQLAEMFG